MKCDNYFCIFYKYGIQKINTNNMIIDEIKKLKDNMPDLQIKEVSFNMEKVYVINIQTVSSSILTNQYVMDYLANRSLFNKSSFSLNS